MKILLLLLPLAALAVLTFSVPADACAWKQQQSTEKPEEKTDKKSV